VLIIYEVGKVEGKLIIKEVINFMPRNPGIKLAKWKKYLVADLAAVVMECA
jgi:hypothetical protein